MPSTRSRAPWRPCRWLSPYDPPATRSGGRLLLANSIDENEDWLLRPWLTRTYRDLFVNVGYTIETEEVYKATKKGVDFDVLMTLYGKLPHEGLARDAS